MNRDSAHYGRIAHHWIRRAMDGPRRQVRQPLRLHAAWWHDLDVDCPVVIERARWNAVQAARAAFRYRPDLREERFTSERRIPDDSERSFGPARTIRPSG